MFAYNRCDFVHSKLNENKFSGGKDRKENGEDSDIILRFDICSETWINVGTMQDKRSGHAMSLVPLKEFIGYCQIDPTPQLNYMKLMSAVEQSMLVIQYV